MPKFLKPYLIITGVMSFLALAMPDLVLIGFFMLIIPGLILSLAPTAFLWGCAAADLSEGDCACVVDCNTAHAGLEQQREALIVAF